MSRRKVCLLMEAPFPNRGCGSVCVLILAICPPNTHTKVHAHRASLCTRRPPSPWEEMFRVFWNSAGWRKGDTFTVEAMLSPTYSLSQIGWHPELESLVFKNSQHLHPPATHTKPALWTAALSGERNAIWLGVAHSICRRKRRTVSHTNKAVWGKWLAFSFTIPKTCKVNPISCVPSANTNPMPSTEMLLRKALDTIL